MFSKNKRGIRPNDKSKTIKKYVYHANLVATKMFAIFVKDISIL